MRTELATEEELDSQYNARAAVLEHAQIFTRWRQQSAEARQRLRCDTDRRYGPASGETLDFFSAGHGTPLLIFIHGGYWRSLDKGDFSFLASAFVDAGVSFAAANYGLLPGVRLEDIVRQMLRACAWCWRNAREMDVDARRIGMAGHSAGGHLAAMMLAAQWSDYAPDLPGDLLHGGLSVSGIYDLTALARAPFIRDDLQLDAAGARRLSPAHYRPRRAVPLYTAVGGEESAEFQRQNRLIRRAWPHSFAGDIAMPGCNHFTIVDALADRRSPLFKAALHMTFA